jgi:cellulose synthase/poly-beta-1,6-N-acetylglucosamine synthase-like glycosyltransferase
MPSLDLVWQSIFWICLGLLVYTYVLYAALVWLLARFFSRCPTPGHTLNCDAPAVTLLIAAHNEEAVIEKKVLNSLALDYPLDRLRIVVASDGSSDATPDIVQRYADRGVRLIHCPLRRGKSATLNAAISETGHDDKPSGGNGHSDEILVLSDANTEYQRDAIRSLVRWFDCPRVDAVCGRLILKGGQSGRNVDGLYWRYETFLKKCEGRLGALLGANGAIYAIRRRAYVPIANNTIIDDFVIPLVSKLRHRGRIIYDPEAVAMEETPPRMGTEFRRRARIGTGAYQSLPWLWRLLHPRHGWTAFSFFSHKLLRWLVPFLLLGMLVANLFLLGHRLYQFTLAAQVAALAVSLAGLYLPGRGPAIRLVRAMSMFTAMNLALLVGFWRWLSTPQTGTWQRTARDGNAAGEIEVEAEADGKAERELVA